MHGHDHHNHNHDGHRHGQATENGLSNIGTAFVLNAVFALVELAGGLWTGSVAILADALHDFGDSLSLGMAYLMQRKSLQSSNSTYSYGYGRMSLISATVTAVVLVAGSVSILAQSIPRLMNPVTPKVDGMLGLAAIGMAVNGFMAWKIQLGETLNERILSWHLLEDVLGWAITFIVALVMKFFEVPILDPLLSILFTLFILRGVLKTFAETMKLFLQATPRGLDVAALTATLLKIPGVKGVHDLHVWSLDGERHVMTLHVVVANRTAADDIRIIKASVRPKIVDLGRVHATIETETEQDDCPDLDCVKP